jgi:hypothetical protein
MADTIKQFMSGLIGGVMASGTATVTLLQDLPLHDIRPGHWLSIVIGGLLAALAAWRTLLAEPPIKK